MKKQEKTALNRALKEEHFEDVKKAIEGGKKSGGLKNPELIEELIKKFKGKTVQAPVEVIVTSAIFLNAREIMGAIEALEHTLKLKVADEIKSRADKGETTMEDLLMLAAILKTKSKED